VGVIADFSLPVILSLGAWTLIMINVPVLGWIYGEGGIKAGISLGVLAQASTVSLLLLLRTSDGLNPLILVAIPLYGLAVEVIGSRTNIPFGDYNYTEELKPQILHVPVVIPLAWLMMIPPAWGIAGALAPEGGLLIQALISGAAFMAWDLFLDPQMTRWNYWRWARPGSYFGIPWVNFLGWFLTAALVTILLRPTNLPIRPLVIIYLITWFLQSVGQIAFWKMIGPGLVGSAVMGALAWSAGALVLF
jgi:putative membrane protein